MLGEWSYEEKRFDMRDSASISLTLAVYLHSTE